MILIVNVCKEKLHELEFVKPIEDILNRAGEDFFVKHYRDMGEKDLAKANKVIICGTSLKDEEFAKDLDKSDWIKDFEKPIFGICAGMQLIGMVFGGKLKKKTEIGFYFENVERDFLGLLGEDEVHEVYHLHNNYIDFSELKDFEVYFKSSNSEHLAQAVKHKKKEIYGVLFHPEVRQKEMILEFVKNG
jgi:GMP synthase (glutamine-hydrolysing)|tara:strand:+ start:423 stop:989 length:567 start_codon:yes stop_codon:yes gene_type:complete